MRIGGFQGVSLIDYPGKVCAVVFAQGCNFRCPYCHNPELVYPELFSEPIPEKEVLSLLEMRKRLIDGVVITGGEPMLQQANLHTGTVTSKSTPICHSRKRSASGILLQTKKDSGQAGMTDKKLKTKKRLLQQRVSFNNDMTVSYRKKLACFTIVP